VPVPVFPSESLTVTLCPTGTRSNHSQSLVSVWLTSSTVSSLVPSSVDQKPMTLSFGMASQPSILKMWFRASIEKGPTS